MSFSARPWSKVFPETEAASAALCSAAMVVCGSPALAARSANFIECLPNLFTPFCTLPFSAPRLSVGGAAVLRGLVGGGEGFLEALARGAFPPPGAEEAEPAVLVEDVEAPHRVA